MTILVEKTKIKSIASRVRSSQILGDWIPDYKPIDYNTENAIFWRGSNCATRFNLNDIHLEAVRKQLFALGNNSNNDVLGFDSKLLFLGADIIAPILTTFYNASLTNEIVISDWKVSKVTPIYKGKGNKEEAGNCRPISLIGHIMKIFEK